MTTDQPKRRGRPPKARPAVDDIRDDKEDPAEQAKVPAAPPASAEPGKDSAPSLVGAPVALKIKTLEPVKDTRKRYWIGLTEDCPVQGATAGCVNFQKNTSAYVEVEGNPQFVEAKSTRVGSIARMDEKQLKATLDSVALVGIRDQGEGYYTPGDYVAGSEPLAWYAWIVEVSEDFQPFPGTPVPATLAPRPKVEA